MARKAASGLALASVLAGALSLGRPALAEDAKPAGSLFLELNAAQPSEKGCRLTFLVTNELQANVGSAAFELALFNSEGVVERLTVLAFKDLPAGKTKVSRFDLASADCSKVGRILINTATECSGDGIAPADCMRGIRTSSKTGIVFGV
jgi:hypothetical protein